MKKTRYTEEQIAFALWLALGMAEKHEKAERMRIMREFGCSELEAAMRVARKICL
ncbi:hypothetical protein NK491_002614 [Morganella morganii]|nr:hypothetical protein [Morganella morganii]